MPRKPWLRKAALAIALSCWTSDFQAIHGQQPNGTFSTGPYQKAPAGQKTPGPISNPSNRTAASQQPIAQRQTQPQAQPGQFQPQAAQSQIAQSQIAPAKDGRPSVMMPSMVPSGRVNPVAPFPQPNPQWQAYLDQVLDAWEKRSAAVNDYECEFKRYQYDPALVENDAYTLAKGVVKYMKPDKGLFRVDQLVFHAGRDQDSKPKYQANPRLEFGEYWICDGQFVDIRDRNKKECNRHELPPNMRGAGIVMSPLPFLFGVKAAEIKDRYWVQALPQSNEKEVWLEAYPKRLDDASNYHHVKVVLDLKDFMPRGLIAYMPNWRADADYREIYEFENRKIDANGNLINRINPFQKEFFPGDPPKDWKVFNEPFQPGPQESPAAPAVPPGQPRVAGQSIPPLK